MITIIGGGVFGLSMGWYLARAGRAVTIFEQGQVGRGATWAAAGMLMPWKLSDNFSLDLFSLQQTSYQQWPEFAQTLSAQTGVDLDYQTKGRYFLALMDKAVHRFRRQFDFHQSIDVPVEWLSGKQARQRLPQLGPEVLAAIYCPLGHWVDNRQLVIALRKAYLQAGGVLHEQTSVLEIVRERQRVQAVRHAEGVTPAESVIIANGAWSGDLLADVWPVSEQQWVRPRKGQSLIVQMNPQQPLVEQSLLGPVYLVPRTDGRLIIGTTVERQAGFNTSPTAAGVYHMLRKGMSMVPEIGELPIIELNAGLRPTAPNRLPVLGPTSINGLILATGGHSHGILLAPAVAQAISQWVMQGRIADSIAPFVPRQFDSSRLGQ